MRMKKNVVEESMSVLVPREPGNTDPAAIYARSPYARECFERFIKFVDSGGMPREYYEEQERLERGEDILMA